jgi:hypothetical protein
MAAYMPHDFIQMPPNSTGQKIHIAKRVVLHFDTIQTGQSFSVGDSILGGTSGATGTVTGIETAGYTAGIGLLWINASTGTWLDDEEIRVSSVWIASVNLNTDTEGGPANTLGIQHVSTVDKENPARSLHITAEGASRVVLPAVTVAESGALLTQDTSALYTQTYDYNYSDPDLFDNEIHLKYTNPLNSAESWAAGTHVSGGTSEASGHVKSIDAVNDILTLTDVVGTFVVGETIHHIHSGVSTIETMDIAAGGVPDVTVNTSTKSIDLSTGGTVAGVGATRTTNTYFPLGRGRSTEAVFGVSMTGATPGVLRRFGMYDEYNGFFWEILESTGLDTTYDPAGALDTFGETVICAVHRTNTTGSVVNHIIAAVNFNVNTLNGTDATGFDLDITRPNLFWIDIPNSGAGSAKFGVYNDAGDKLLAHTFSFNNSALFSGAPIPASALPIREEVRNFGAGVTNQETILKMGKVTVYTNENASRYTNAQTFLHGNVQNRHAMMDDTRGEVPLIAVRAERLLNSIVNRTYSKLHDMNVNLQDERIDRFFGGVIATDAIPMVNHNLLDGDKVQYQDGVGATVTGLDDHQYYYVIKIDADNIKLASTYELSRVPTPLTISGGVVTNKLVEAPGTVVTLRIRKNSDIADATWSRHNTVRSASSWSQNATGFRLSENVVVATGGTNYVAGDILELDSGIVNHREAVLEVIEVSAGAIVKVRILPLTGGHLLETDGVSNANYGSYNGKISGAIGHKASGVGFSACAGAGATFSVSVKWGHGFWWTNFYKSWGEYNFGGSDILSARVNQDIAFCYGHSDNSEENLQNLTVTGQVYQPGYNAKVQLSLNWQEIQ